MNHRITIIIFIVTIITILYLVIPAAPSLLANTSFSQRVFDRKGKLMRLSLSEDDKYRIFTPINEIPKKFKEAVILYEDQYFYSHFGVNPISLTKAFCFTYLKNTRKIGGSTITMQVARLMYKINSSNIFGKLYQIIKALHLELRYSKEQILEAYLNLISYGQNIEGIGAASLIYFERDVKDLSLIEILNLAVIPQNPIKRGTNKTSNFAIKYLFQRWLKEYPNDIIYENLLNLPINFKTLKDLPFTAPHFTLDILKANKKLSSIYTTIDKDLQNILEKQISVFVKHHKAYGINNAAAILIDWTDTEVLASIGSSNFFDHNINGQVNGVLSYRSSGSTLKPFIYALAFDQSLIHPLTLLKDIPTNYDGYRPQNFDMKFLGAISAKESLIKSRNIPVIFLASKLKNPNFYEFLAQTKIKKLQKTDIYGLSIALGSAEVNLEELATLYVMLANLGTYKPLRKLINPPIETNEQKDLISPESCYLTLDILKETVRPQIYQNINIPIYWKTGTSSSFKDALAIGIFGKYVLAVWVGDFKGQAYGNFVSNKTSVPLFFDITKIVIDKNMSRDLIQEKLPSLNITNVTVCADTGDIDNNICPIKTKTLFIKGKSPIKSSGAYQKILIDVDTKMPACKYIKGKTEYKIVNLQLAELTEIYKNAGIHILPQNLTSNYCGKLANIFYRNPQINPSLKNSVYSIKNSDKIVLTATVDANVTNIFWFINDELIANVKPNKPVMWQAKPGEFIIRVIDNNGVSDSAKINFQN